MALETAKSGEAMPIACTEKLAAGLSFRPISIPSRLSSD
jgi:hypothetical protein